MSTIGSEILVLDADEAVTPSVKSSKREVLSMSGTSTKSSQSSISRATGADIKLKVTDLEDGMTHIHVVPETFQLAKRGNRVHLVFVVDVSGSMGTGVESVSADGKKEDNGFSILDLVKHSLLTILNSLGETHLVTLISFTDRAEVVFEKLKMKPSNLKKAKDAVMNLMPQASTNLWAGMKEAFNVLVKDQKDGREDHGDKYIDKYRKEIMVFTDGMPNNNPPKGHIQTIKEYVQKNEVPFHTVRTYGFGYSLDSKLLEEIAIVGRGTFSFIPDAGFVGTIFIHSLASILAGCHIANANVHVVPNSGKAKDVNQILGHQRCATISSAGVISIPLGSNIEIGQAVDLVIKKPDYAKISLSYTDLNMGEFVEIEVKRGLEAFESPSKKSDYKKVSASSNPRTFAIAKKLADTHAFRLDMCDKVHALVAGKEKFGREGQNMGHKHATAEDVGKAFMEVKKLVEDYKEMKAAATSATAFDDADLLEEFGANEGLFEKCDELVKGLFEDLEGQVMEAFSKREYYNRWGAFYLRSLLFAHLMQKRNNFKDIGVQNYGGSVFNDYVDKINDIFDNTTPPPPSCKYSSGPVVAVTSMSGYNNSYGPCFSGDSLVEMADGSQVRCADVKKGDLLRSGRNAEIVKVRCAIKTQGSNMVAIKFSQLDNLTITPWHPIYLNGAWKFPAEVAVETPAEYIENIDIETVYNFVLEIEKQFADHTIRVNNVTTCTLGHGIVGDGVVEHDYYGSMNKVVRDLRVMHGWQEGQIALVAETCCVKSMLTGKVERMMQNQFIEHVFSDWKEATPLQMVPVL